VLVCVSQTKMPRRKLSYAQLEDKVRKLEFTNRTRGSRIGALYHTLQRVIENHPDAVPVSSTVDLKQQLDQAREALRQRMQQPTTTSSEPDVAFSGACIVCYSAFNGETHKPTVLNCGHLFCEECILKHMTNKTAPTCPCCRRVFGSFISIYM